MSIHCDTGFVSSLLFCDVPLDSPSLLYGLCRRHTQPKFILHDGIAAGIFNDKFSGGSGQFSQWDRYLENSPALLSHLLDRVQKDFESAAPKMRKPWGQKDLDTSFCFQIYVWASLGFHAFRGFSWMKRVFTTT